MEKFKRHLQVIQNSGRHFILCGDFNIVRSEKDIKNWKSNQKNSGCLPEERAWLNEFFEKQGFIDGFRSLYPHKVQYSWWSQRGQAFAHDVGWRIDYHMLSAGLQHQLVSIDMPRAPKFSDHAPVIGMYTNKI